MLLVARRAHGFGAPDRAPTAPAATTLHFHSRSRRPAVDATTPLLEDSAASSSSSGEPGAGAAPPRPLPDEVLLFMLRREALLTRAKLHYLVFEHISQEKDLRILKQLLRQVRLCMCV